MFLPSPPAGWFVVAAKLRLGNFRFVTSSRFVEARAWIGPCLHWLAGWLQWRVLLLLLPGALV